MFDDFWKLYPRQVCKKPAEKAWKSAIRRERPETIIAAVRKYAAERHGKDQQFTCHAATWLNQDRWQDYRPQDMPDPRAAEQSLEWTRNWISAGHYASWVRDDQVRDWVSAGVLNKDAAKRAGYLV